MSCLAISEPLFQLAHPFFSLFLEIDTLHALDSVTSTIVMAASPYNELASSYHIG